MSLLLVLLPSKMVLSRDTGAVKLVIVIYIDI